MESNPEGHESEDLGYGDEDGTMTDLGVDHWSADGVDLVHWFKEGVVVVHWFADGVVHYWKLNF